MFGPLHTTLPSFVVIMGLFFFIDRMLSDLVWSVFARVAGEKEWPDCVRLDLASEKELAQWW